MRFITTLLILLFVSISSFGQSNGKNDWQKRNLNGKVKTIVEVLNDSKKDYQLDSFDTEGYLIKSIFFYDSNDDTSASIATDNPAYINKYVTLFYYDNAHHLLKRTYGNMLENLAETTKFKYDGKWRLTEVAIDNNGAHIVSKFEYDSKGQLLKELTDEQGKLDNNSVFQQTITFKYNAKNQLIEVNASLSPNDGTESQDVYYNMYEYFNVTSEGYFAGKAIMKYNTNGKIIGQDIFDYKGKPSGRVFCKYDKNNNIIYLILSISGKPFVSNIIYKYDTQNNWVEKRQSKDLVYTRTITYY